MPSSALANMERGVEAQLAAETQLTPAAIREWIAQFRVLFPCTDAEAEALAKKLEVRHDVSMKLGSALVNHDFVPWLDAAIADIDFYYWHRYRRLLEQQHFSAQVIGTLHRETDRILGYLQDPKREGPWSRRGMVVGYVQSGKTANYIGLMSKAADAGYRLIIVIAGVHNNLRNQTQKRIDLGFVGRDSARLLSRRDDRYVGVGRFDARRRPVTFTNSLKDFSKEMATGVGVPLQNLNEPAVFVIKKHPKTLENLVSWLQEHNAARGAKIIDEPMLLIDDEADNASINVKYSAGDVTRINGQIRALLKLFARNCYVGYTATPFANIFIDPDSNDAMVGEDLFPRDFIVSLDPPTNYFGASRVFIDEPMAIVRHIEDNGDVLPLSHPKTVVLRSLPGSLRLAIRTFIVARAIRLLRGDASSHSSMLVNASRFTDVQTQLRILIEADVEAIKASARISAALDQERALRDTEIRALHEAWKAEFAEVHPTWDDIQAKLLEAAAPIRVVEVNSRSHGTLNYEDYANSGLSVIAVGGYSLSRGLTLEGLMMSYVLRNSMMYDTLMQMGRWFGYRDGYADLCRVWLPEEAEGWYAHITESMEMLREEFRLMAAAGATPREFGLKVRAHPDTLIVTARNKMGSSQKIVVRIGLGKSFVETTPLWGDRRSLAANRNAAATLARDLRALGLLEAAADVPGGRLIPAVPVQPVRTFVAAFVNHPLSLLTEPAPVGKYIADRERDELALWDVLIAGVREPRAGGLSDRTFGFRIECQRRSAGKGSNGTAIRVTNKHRVASRGIEKTGLSPEQISEAERSYEAQVRPTSGQAKRLNYPDWIYRAKRPRPLLIVHALEIVEQQEPDAGGDLKRVAEEPVIAWSISFPATAREEEQVEFMVNKTWLEENSQSQSEDDDLDADDL